MNGISVAAIVEAVDGPIAITTCQSGDKQECVIEGHCSVRGHWGPINQAVRAALEAVSLADMLHPVAPPPRIVPAPVHDEARP